MNKNKITINSIFGNVIWESEKETLKEAVIEKYEYDADLRYANLYDADLYDADLRDANLRGANLRDADLHGADLYGADLYGADLYDANLRDADLRDADLHDADLRGADLYGADLRDADLHGADLYGANLRGADLHGADLRDANLHGADLRDADLRDADLKKLPLDFINQCSRDILFILQSLKSEAPHLKKMLIEGKVDGSQYEGECACLVGTLAHGEDVKKTCDTIPFYERGTHNMGETWFLNIKKGDTPENNEFAKHVLMLIDHVLEGKPLVHPYDY